jgi:uncharacterized protein DUF695
VIGTGTEERQMTNPIPDGPWTVAMGEDDGRPMIVRINAGAASHAGDAGFRHRVGVTMPFEVSNPLGLPGPDQSAALDALEDELVPALTAQGTATLVLSITASGKREFVFYTSSPDVVVSQLGALSTKGDLQHIIEEDPAWDFYKQFADALEEG